VITEVHSLNLKLDHVTTIEHCTFWNLYYLFIFSQCNFIYFL